NCRSSVPVASIGARFDTTRSLDSLVATTARRCSTGAGPSIRLLGSDDGEHMKPGGRDSSAVEGRVRVTLPVLDTTLVLEARDRAGLVAIFDLDGTLAPIAPTPARARVSAAVRRGLHRLARKPDMVIGVVSGRPLKQVERLVGGRDLWLAGLHGAVRRRPG